MRGGTGCIRGEVLNGNEKFEQCDCFSSIHTKSQLSSDMKSRKLSQLRGFLLSIIADITCGEHSRVEQSIAEYNLFL